MKHRNNKGTAFRLPAAACLFAATALFPGSASGGRDDPLNDRDGSEEWEHEEQPKTPRDKERLKEQMKDYEDTRKKFNAGKQEIRQERSVIVTSPGGNHGAPPAAPAAKSKSNEDWRNKEADLLMGRYGVEKEEAPPPAAKSTQAPAKKGKAPAKKEEEVVEDDFIIGPADPSAIQIIRTKPQPQQPPPIQPQQGAQQPQQQAQPAKPPPATPPPPPPPPPPKPKEPTAEDILKKQKGHFDEGSGQFVDDELMEETGKKKKK